MTAADALQSPTADRAGRIFPLHLTPFEEYMLWDDRPEYPMTFVVQLDLEGEIDREALTETLPLALERHPLLQAIVGPAKGNRDCWITAPNPQVMIDWADWEVPVGIPNGEAINLRKQVGLRIWVRTKQQRSMLTLQFHHAAADGIGAYQFIGDWLWYYAERVGQPVTQPLPPNDAKALRRRGKASYSLDNYRLPNGQLEVDKREAFTYALKSMLPVAAPRRADPQRNQSTECSERFPGLCGYEFDKANYKQLRHVAEARGQSANELLIERLLVSLRAWNKEQGKDKKGTFCIMMPMDLREADTRMGTAANLVTYALVRRDREECMESEQLIDSLRQEMVRLKHQRHRTPFMNMMAYLTRYPSWLKRWYAGRGCAATAILSNTGDPTKRFTVPLPSEKGIVRAGNLRLLDISGVPPMRNGTHLTISIFTYRRVLKICLRCDPHRFTVAQSQQFLDHYTSMIHRL